MDNLIDIVNTIKSELWISEIEYLSEIFGHLTVLTAICKEEMKIFLQQQTK